MATIAKPRKPVAEATRVAQLAAAAEASKAPTINKNAEENITVEQFLEKQFELMMTEFRAHSASLVKKLRDDYQVGAAQINEMMSSTASSSPVCVSVRVTAGPHIGQRFRLEGTSPDGEDVFRIGRSTGKMFKEKGLSLYKDKEISTTHARIEIRNGAAFVIDAESTNGTTLNGEDLDPKTPYRLKNDDIIGLGSTELSVHISNVDQENVSINAETY